MHKPLGFSPQSAWARNGCIPGTSALGRWRQGDQWFTVWSQKCGVLRLHSSVGASIGLRDISFSGLVFGGVAQAFFNNSIRIPISNFNGIFGSYTHRQK